MVPITGRASASFSSMLKLKRIGMNNTGVTGLTAKKKTLSMRVGRTNSAYAVNLTYDRRTTYPDIIGERAKRARHSQVCSIENRIYIVRANFVLITRKEGGA